VLLLLLLTTVAMLLTRFIEFRDLCHTLTFAVGVCVVLFRQAARGRESVTFTYHDSCSEVRGIW